jgi:hypothetical protein
MEVSSQLQTPAALSIVQEGLGWDVVTNRNNRASPYWQTLSS